MKLYYEGHAGVTSSIIHSNTPATLSTPSPHNFLQLEHVHCDLGNKESNYDLKPFPRVNGFIQPSNMKLPQRGFHNVTKISCSIIYPK